MTDVQKVLIVGGGIGGLTAAIALRRRDIEVDLVEINPDWSVYGVGIIQPGNAIRALDSLGLAEPVIAAGCAMENSRYHDRDGNVIADTPAPRVAGPDYPPINGITRPRLHDILTAAVRASGTDVRLGVTIDALEQSETGVDVTFTDGTAGTYDLVIGADGINSAVRAMVIGPELKPAYTGQVCWRYNVTRPPDVDRLLMFIGTNGKAGCVPLAPDLMYILLIEEPPEGEIRVPDERLAEVMRERLAEFGGVIGEKRDAEITDPSKVVLRPVESIFVPAPWYRGRVVLIGDAVHATSPHVGQGAAMAIEDSVVLAEELAADQSLEAALDAFMGRRHDRCRLVFDVSRGIGELELAHDHGPGNVELVVKSVMATAEPI